MLARSRTSRWRSVRSMRDAVGARTICTRLSSRTRPPPGASPICAGAPVAVLLLSESRDTYRREITPRSLRWASMRRMETS